MRDFSFKTAYAALLTPEIVGLLSVIHEYKGAQALLTRDGDEALSQLTELARIQSTDASNRIEGIRTSDERLRKLVQEKTMPRSRSEQEIAGYRDVLGTIHSSYDYIPLKPSILLQLHRDLYKFAGAGFGGAYKSGDNAIRETLPDGTERVRFRPVAAWETPEAVSKLCDAYNEAAEGGALDPLLLIPVFVLDFLCIHPFNDGNGRMSRLLTLLLLYRAGYSIGKYVSLEKLIADSKESYYEALQESSLNWHENKNDYLPFARYLLGVIAAAYREFERRAGVLTAPKSTKGDQVRQILRDSYGPVTKREILALCPGVSQITVQRALAELVAGGEVEKRGGGRYTSYIWNRDKE